MESEADAPFYESIIPESNTMFYGGIAAIIILGVGFWFFVGRKKGKFHAQGKEMMNKAKVKVQNALKAMLVTYIRRQIVGDRYFATKLRHQQI